MADLKTTYMGINLTSPIVVGACSLSKRVDTIKEIEGAGAGALVLKSLFEEQIQLERAAFEQELAKYDDMYGEAVTLFPQSEHAGPKEHLYWVSEAKKAVKMPLIASLNCVGEDVWVDYAKQLAEAGVDGLELNFYSLPLDRALGAAEIEKQEVEVFAKVKQAVKIPVAVKLHPFYTNMLAVAQSFAEAGADALVLFNRLFQPDINIEKEAESASPVLSGGDDIRLPLRWVALLHGRVKADLIGSTGVIDGRDVVKMLLAGATAVQVASTLYRNKIPHLRAMLADVREWMDGKGYGSLADFRGKVSKKAVKDPWGFERGQYIKALLGFD